MKKIRELRADEIEVRVGIVKKKRYIVITVQGRTL